MKKGSFVVLVIFTVFFLVLVFAGSKLPKPNVTNNPTQVLRGKTSPSPFVFRTYSPPKIQSKDVYNIVLIGDSMTHALGPHGGSFNTFLHDAYKGNKKGFLVDNYASGSTNILSVGDQLTKKTTYWDSTFEPLLSRDFDLILVESFGYNPLSSMGIEEGIKRQTQALGELMTTLITARPNSAVVFVATIAPNKENYAKNTLSNIPTSQRVQLAEERMLYIKNHISYAKEHNIQVVNIYEKSLTPQGTGNLKYINPTDYIHPSFEGIDFIGHELANFIYAQQTLPH